MLVWWEFEVGSWWEAEGGIKLKCAGGKDMEKGREKGLARVESRTCRPKARW